MTEASCPCGSIESYDKCCAPFISGKKQPESAEKLLRARYSAFVKNQPDYILQTHHPEKVSEIDRATVEDWAKNSEWLGLDIREVGSLDNKGDEQKIEFVAKYRTSGLTQAHHEVSLFKKHDGRWTFFDVVKFIREPVRRDRPVAGRNDPCTCGSGKKFKKCCGAN